MTLAPAAVAQMAATETRRATARTAAREADTADALDRLRRFDHVFTTLRRVGQTVGRNGLVVGFDVDTRALKLLELVPDLDPCVACSRQSRRVETRLVTVAYTEVTEVHRPEWAARTGWALRLLGAVLDGRNVTEPRARQLLAWAGELGTMP